MNTGTPLVEPIKQLTAIYRKDYGWGYGNPAFRYVELKDDETVADMLEREGLAEDIQFLFIGHPALLGTED